uniref:Uncharacterized protein n=1 Tax=Anguilla anguilla TaxID=7936 RepID=A0A0E9QII0_ANGAN
MPHVNEFSCLVSLNFSPWLSVSVSTPLTLVVLSVKY